MVYHIYGKPRLYYTIYILFNILFIIIKLLFCYNYVYIRGTCDTGYNVIG